MSQRTLRDRFGSRQMPGDVGVEVEVEWEGDRLPGGIAGVYSIPNSMTVWEGHADNSLRNGYEYITGGAIPVDTLKPALESLYAKMPGKRRWSQRTSVHCHFNMLEKPVLKIFNNILGFWALEDLIIEQCAPHRKGNLFALPWRLADNQVTNLVEDYNRDRLFTTFQVDRFKYACLNLCNLPRKGTLEFRALEGSEDRDKIVCMFEGIHQMFENLQKFDDPAQLFDWFYATKSAEEVIDKLLPNELGSRLKQVKGYQDLMRDAIEMLSYAAYLNWDRERKNTTKGRDAMAGLNLDEMFQPMAIPAGNNRMLNIQPAPRWDIIADEVEN